MTDLATPVRLLEIQVFERTVHFRMPFRFGVITLTEEPQIFIKALVELSSGKLEWGQSAEVLGPKWFDKNLSLSHEENYRQLLTSLSVAGYLYSAEKEKRSAFDLSTGNSAAQYSACGQRGLNGLIAGYGPALLDRAVLDAICRHHGISFFEAVKRNLPGIRVLPETPELDRFPIGEFLEKLRPLNRVHARHTVGLVDPIRSEDLSERLNDGLPETLEEVVRYYGNTYFKIKLSGRPADDVDRLKSIAAVLDAKIESYTATLDGNEQYPDVDAVLEFWDTAAREPRLHRFLQSVVLIEQPITRHHALDQDVSRLDARCPVMIDESDTDLDAFPRAKYCGYSGVSSKQCKGIYRALINAARCHRWNEGLSKRRFFMTGEDLTIQPGVALNQDLALAALLGLHHIERNGHHYVRGFDGVSRAEQEAFLQHHPDLYTRGPGFVRLNLVEGCLDLGSLRVPGIGTQVFPDWTAMRRIQ